MLLKMYKNNLLPVFAIPFDSDSVREMPRKKKKHEWRNNDKLKSFTTVKIINSTKLLINIYLTFLTFTHYTASETTCTTDVSIFY